MDLEAALQEDHRKLDQLFEELLNFIHVGDTGAADTTWTRFEKELLGHLEAEEQWLLPVFEREDPKEATWIREEHEQIRADLAELGLGLEIHALREDVVERFVGRLRTHATREQQKLYGWAGKELPEMSKRSLWDWFNAVRGRMGSSILG